MNNATLLYLTIQLILSDYHIHCLTIQHIADQQYITVCIAFFNFKSLMLLSFVDSFDRNQLYVIGIRFTPWIWYRNVEELSVSCLGILWWIKLVFSGSSK